MNVEQKKHIREVADDVRNLCAVSAYGIENIFKDAEDRLHYHLVRYPIGEKKSWVLHNSEKRIRSSL